MIMNAVVFLVGMLVGMMVALIFEVQVKNLFSSVKHLISSLRKKDDVI